MIRNAHAWLASVGLWALIAVSLAEGAEAQSPIQRGQSLPPPSASQRKDDAEGSENTIKFRITRRPRQKEAATPAPGAAAEKYSSSDGTWFRDALRWDVSPVDLSFLNAADRPAGRRGFVKADGDRLVFEDGTPARFWGANLSGPALFGTPRENVPRQARRIAQLGYNL
ncbi:MAG: hypothetical protein JO344_14520, partial [Planctomycetaceae bacterium]|nr:hypothetical protein [Planctomycetaceae bacterium]